MKRFALQHSVFSQRKRFLLLFLILLIVCAVIWILLSLYASQSVSKIPQEAQEAAVPLDPNLNSTLLSELESKALFSQEDLLQFPIYVIKVDRFTRTQSVVPLESR